MLINAYAVSPSWGSEPGVGWNWVTRIANYCEVYVITEGEWRDEILAALESLPQRDRLHFYFLPVSERVRSMCWNQGDWRFYFHYARWQRRALKLARQIVADHHIDVMHQLNMIGFREPGYLWRIPDVPLVWGPIGGDVHIPRSFIRGSGAKQYFFNTIKTAISDLQFRFHPRVRKMMRRSYPIAAVKTIKDLTLRHYGRDITLIPETGIDMSVGDASVDSRPDGRPLALLWVGKFDFRKRLDIALEAVARCRADVRLTVCGTGSPEDVDHYRRLADDLAIADRVTWMGKVDHRLIDGMMRQSDLFLFTSIVEATSTVVLEAISAGLPVLSHNACGFGPIVKEFAGIAIDVVNPQRSVADFAAAIDALAADRSRLSRIAEAERANRDAHSWESKAKTITQIYTTLCQPVG